MLQTGDIYQSTGIRIDNQPRTLQSEATTSGSALTTTLTTALPTLSAVTTPESPERTMEIPPSHTSLELVVCNGCLKNIHDCWLRRPRLGPGVAKPWSTSTTKDASK